jgi:hypothetical protein
MPSFGSFETEREVYSDPIYTVYFARKTGDPKSEYAVKVFTIQRAGFDPETITELGPLLGDIERNRVESIALQAKGAAVSVFIAPVLETGRDERGVWYVTRFYPRSINRIISGKVALSREALQHLILSIAQGALDLKRACGRSHGDIRPSSVQISKSEKLSEAEVVLSDLLPGGTDEAARYEISDLRSIGRILLQLVRQREIGNEEDFLILPILASAEWTRLFGKETDRWLLLCNRLLDPNLSLEQLSLEQLVAELGQLQPKSKVSPRLIISAAAGLALLAVVAFVVSRLTGYQKLEITSDPPSATILVDQKEQEGKTPLKLKLKRGNYVIEARHETLKLLEQTTNWVAQSGAPPRLHFRFPYGSVAIKSEPPGATISRDGVEIGKTAADGSPFVVPIVAAGLEVKYELTLSDHLVKPVRGVVTNGQRLVLSETLPLVTDVGTVDLDSTPPGAKVFWKDKLLTSATPERVQLEQGSYTLTAVYNDWPTQLLSVVVRKKEEVPATFVFPFGTVSLNSDPSDAVVWVGTNRIGNTPKMVRRPAGSTTFRFEHPGFETTNVTVNVVDKGMVTVKPSLITSNGIFELSAEPGDALILDSTGKEIGRTTTGTPFTTNFPPGTYTFTARMEGLNDVVATLPVGKREVKKYAFIFDYGTVLLDSLPPGASITANGKMVGTTPAKLVQKPGVKTIYRISVPDYLPETNEVTVTNHDFNQVRLVKLVPEPVSVALTSDPPGAQFYLEGAALAGTGSVYSIAWGTNLVLANHPRLVGVTNTVAIQKGAQKGGEFKFKFDYGTLILTNLPDDVRVSEGGEDVVVRLGGGGLRLAYERPGPHTYDLDWAGKKDTVKTNLPGGSSIVLVSEVVGREFKNGIGLRLVKVPDLFGPGKNGWVGKFEVTEAEYEKVMGADANLSTFKGPDLPVENVTWKQAQAFCDMLTQMDKKPPPDYAGRYGLPTVELWEKIAAGATLKTAVFAAKQPAPVGSKGAANSSGVSDILGNVAEWLAGDDAKKMAVGGGFRDRSDFRGKRGFTEPQQKDGFEDDLGFRVLWLPAQ